MYIHIDIFLLGKLTREREDELNDTCLLAGRAESKHVNLKVIQRKKKKAKQAIGKKLKVIDEKKKKTFEPRTRNNKKSPTRFNSCRVSIHEISISNGRIFEFSIFFMRTEKKSVKYPATEFSKKEKRKFNKTH